MLRAVDFFAPGLPAPQGSKRAFIQGGRAVVVDVRPQALKVWRESVTAAATIARARRDPLTGPVRCETHFVLPRPKTVKRLLPHVPPDLDKLVRAVWDGITDAKVWKDDSQVVDMSATKRYAETGKTGVTVWITSLEGEQHG